MSNINIKISNYYGERDLVEKFQTIYPVLYDKNQIFWKWNIYKYKWEIVDETEILNILDDSIVFNASQKDLVNKKNVIIELLKRTGRTNFNNLKEIDTNYIQFGKYLFNVKTDEIIQVNSNYFITNPIPYELSNSSETPFLDQLFVDWVGEKYKNTLYEIIAYCLIPNQFMQRMFILIGSGSNGKSVFLNIISKFLGKENITTTELDYLIENRFETSKLYKKLVCQMGETNFNELKATSLLKKISGGDLLSFEYKNKQPFDDICYSKLIISTNTLPITHDKTDGWFRRVLIINFPNKFNTMRDIINEIPEQEFKNLTLKSLNILKELLKNRKFTNEGTVEDRKKLYEDNSNPFVSFLRDNYMDSSGSFIPFYEFYNDLCHYFKERGYNNILSKNKVSMLLREENLETAREYYTQSEFIDNEFKKIQKHYIIIKGIKKREKVPNEIKVGGGSFPMEIQKSEDLKRGLKANPHTPLLFNKFNELKNIKELESEGRGFDNTLLKIIKNYNDGISFEKLDSLGYSQEKLNLLLKKGDIYENPKGIYRILE